jgi:hypothetical protein
MNYFRSQDIKNIAMIGYLGSFLRDLHARTKEVASVSKETQRTVGMGATWTNKAYDVLVRELDHKKMKQVLNFLNSWRGGSIEITGKSIIPKGEPIQELAKDEWFEIVAHCIAGGCPSNCDQPSDCRIKEILLKYDVPYSDCGGKCPYWNYNEQTAGELGTIGEAYLQAKARASA